MRPVNLLPDELRPRQRRSEGSGPAHIVLGVLGVLLVMVVVYAFSLNEVNSRKTDIASAKGEIEKAKTEVAASTAFGDFHKVKETRVASVKQLAAGRFDWERLMRELALVLPDRIWLLDATASTSAENAPGGTPGGAPSTSGGSTASSTAGAAGEGSSSPSLDLKGCALRQRDVAVLLVRLRKLHRAEDVDLKESTAETAGATGAQTSGAANAGGSESCGNKRFRFEVVVTFSQTPEGEKPAGGKVPAKLGGGS